MPTKSARWTRFDLERFPEDGNRYEVLDGELLVTPQAAPDHQVVAARLGLALGNYCESTLVGLSVGPGAVVWGKNELQPDIEVLPRSAYRRGLKWEQMPVPLLVVEVLSPFSVSARRDFEVKRKAYLARGIQEYWVVDHEKRRVHVWSGGRDAAIVTDLLRWHPDPAVAPFEISLEKLFDPVSE
jgi:Uma2 family endonuclease